MHIGTHFFAGWLFAVAPRNLSRRERATIAFAGVAPDLDGVGIVVEQITANWTRPHLWYSNYHHFLGHNLGFALAVTVAASLLAKRRAQTALLAFAAFHLHLLCDLAGSRGSDGDQWPIPYLLPFSKAWQLTWSGQWTLSSWQNSSFTAVLLLAVAWAAWYYGRSPLGLFSEKGDATFVATLRHRFGTPAS